MSRNDVASLRTAESEKLAQDSKPWPVHDKGVQLYSNPICPYAQRAWISIYEKRVPHEFVHIGLGDEKPQWYVDQVNSRGTVPALRHDGHMVYESAIVAEYLDDAFHGQGTELLPRDPLQRAAIRLFAADADSKFISNFYGLIRNADPAKDKELVDKVVAGLKTLDSQISKEGPFFLGKNFSLADVIVFPFLLRADILLRHWRKFDLFAYAKVPRVAALYENALKREAVAATVPSNDFLINAYSKYAGQVRELSL